MVFAETNIMYRTNIAVLPVTICIECPYLSQSGKYRTKIHFKGLWDEPQEICGEDSFQSLMLAVKVIKDCLCAFINNDGNGLYCYEEKQKELIPKDLSIWGWKIII